MPDGIDLVLIDHRWVDELFASFEASGDPTVVGQIFDALAAHDDAEHGALYPLAGTLLGDPAMLERFAAAHSAVKQQIDRIRHTEGAALLAGVTQLKKLVDAHVRDEETKLLPKIRDAATPQQLEELGARIQATKQRVG
jgi:hemerythrin superfamily protein